jgi:hypothetical protein
MRSAPGVPFSTSLPLLPVMVQGSRPQSGSVSLPELSVLRITSEPSPDLMV